MILKVKNEEEIKCENRAETTLMFEWWKLNGKISLKHYVDG